MELMLLILRLPRHFLADLAILQWLLVCRSAFMLCIFQKLVSVLQARVVSWPQNNYLLTCDSYVPLYNRFHRGEWITRVSGGEGALDTPGPLNGTSEASAIWPRPFGHLATAIWPFGHGHLALPPTHPSNPFPPMKSIIHGHIRISGQ
jgi:hypothetical protein